MVHVAWKFTHPNETFISLAESLVCLLHPLGLSFCILESRVGVQLYHISFGKLVLYWLCYVRTNRNRAITISCLLSRQICLAMLLLHP